MDYNDLFTNLDLSSAEKVSCYVVRVANAFQDLLARTEKAESDAKYWKSIAENWEYIFHNESNARRQAEARVLELETSHRTELCDSGFECVELGKVRKALEEAVARAEKAERERDDFKAKYIEAVKRACELSKIVDDHGWEE